MTTKIKVYVTEFSRTQLLETYNTALSESLMGFDMSELRIGLGKKRENIFGAFLSIF